MVVIMLRVLHHVPKLATTPLASNTPNSASS